MWRYSRDRLSAPVSLWLTPPSRFSSISWHRAGPFGPVVPLGVVLAPTAPDPALRLTDALAATEPVDHVLGDGLVKALPVLLGNEDSGKHGGMWGKEIKRAEVSLVFTRAVVENRKRAGKRMDLYHRSTSIHFENTKSINKKSWFPTDITAASQTFSMSRD